MTKLSLSKMGLDGKATMAFVVDTNKQYAALSIRLHQTACVAFYRAAQFGDADALNMFYSGLRVNDQTALRVWIGQHSSYMDLDLGATRNWIKFNAKQGFALVKGVESHRKDMFTVETNEDGKQMLLALKPFYDKNVKDKDAITLEVLMNMMKRTADQMTKKAEAEGIKLPADVLKLTTSMKNTAAKELAAIERVTE